MSRSETLADHKTLGRFSADLAKSHNDPNNIMRIFQKAQIAARAAASHIYEVFKIKPAIAKASALFSSIASIKSIASIAGLPATRAETATTEAPVSLPFGKNRPRLLVNNTEPEHKFMGRHLIVSYFGCDDRAIRDIPGLNNAMKEAVRASGATLLKSAGHVFPPDGMTSVFLLSESHASIHTYPEFGSCFVDLFTCGSACSAEKFDAALRGFLKPQEVHSRVLLRHRGIQEDRLRNN